MSLDADPAPRGAGRLRTLGDLGDLAGARVLVRAEFNVPLRADGEVADDTRLRLTLPTIVALRARGARVLIVAHLGRPRDREPSLSLRPVAARLAQLLGEDVALARDLEHVVDGDVVMLENIRFERGETDNDPALAARLGALADAYVNDAFGSAHRVNASTVGVARHVARSAAGLLFEREIAMLQAVLRSPARPLVAVLGGAKVTDKIGVIERFLELADAVLIGGAMSFPFLAAQGHGVGDSLCDADDVAVARRVLAHTGGRLHLPLDVVVADRFAADATWRAVDAAGIEAGWMGLDVGPLTCAAYADVIERAGTVFWNGPVGAFELEPFAAGTRAVAEAIARTDATTVVGGGDLVAALNRFGLADRVTHICTGGGAGLEFIEGRVLPAYAALASERR
ncbi:MAG TPA: phosphoglycerate kinase [Solirubrobacteraceae bacterium]|nr:phosphoglycerate kinase [Solirubrobacteraceae bacterium]